MSKPLPDLCKSSTSNARAPVVLAVSQSTSATVVKDPLPHHASFTLVGESNDDGKLHYSQATTCAETTPSPSAMPPRSPPPRPDPTSSRLIGKNTIPTLDNHSPPAHTRHALSTPRRHLNQNPTFTSFTPCTALSTTWLSTSPTGYTESPCSAPAFRPSLWTTRCQCSRMVIRGEVEL